MDLSKLYLNESVWQGHFFLKQEIEEEMEGKEVEKNSFWKSFSRFNLAQSGFFVDYKVTKKLLQKAKSIRQSTMKEGVCKTIAFEFLAHLTKQTQYVDHFLEYVNRDEKLYYASGMDQRSKKKSNRTVKDYKY